MARQGDLLLEIVTPEGVALQEWVDEVVAPSVDGEFGVLPGHLPMLAALRIGLLHFREGGRTTDVAVGLGFAEILHDKAVVLTDRYKKRDDVDVLSVRERLEEVDGELDKWSGDLNDPKRLQLIEEEQWLATQLELIGDPPQPKVLEHSRLVDYSAVIPELEQGESEEDEAK
jgi:F-type H+-transporting ATPase subunit epsilon